MLPVCACTVDLVCSGSFFEPRWMALKINSEVGGGSSVVEHVLSMHKALPVSSSWLPSEKGSSLARLYRHRLCENRSMNLVDSVGQYLSSVLGGSCAILQS